MLIASDKLIQLALADTHKIFRDGIRIGMKNRDSIKIIWEAQDRKDMMQKLKYKTPDVLLMDIKMTGTDAIKDIQLIKREYEELKIIIFSLCDDMEIITEVMAYGANSYLDKSVDADEIYKAIISCLKDNFYFNDLLNNAVLTKLKNDNRIKKLYPKVIKFNDKELKILKLISDDKTTDEISDEIFLSPRTVETIRQNMKTKVGAKTIAGLVTYAFRNKLVH